MFGASETSSSKFQSTDTNGPSSPVGLIVAVICAVAVTAGLLYGYAFLRKRNAEKLRAQTTSQNEVAKPSPPPEVHVFSDEAMIKGSEAVIGGTIQNISPNKLIGLTVELYLKRRKDNGSEVRVVLLEPRDLEPQQQGRYSFIVPSRAYREAHVQGIKSSRSPGDVPFKILEGAQRPDERLPTKEIIVVTPSKKGGKGEEFINTPDNPVSVP